MEALLLLLVVLLCPLMMYFCMRGMRGHTHGQQESHSLTSGETRLIKRVMELETQQQVLLSQMTAFQNTFQQDSTLRQKLIELETQQQILLDQLARIQNAIQRLSPREGEHENLDREESQAGLFAWPALSQSREPKQT